MDDQWCWDECSNPNCGRVVHAGSMYCSPKCEPQPDPELETAFELDAESIYDYPSWTQRNNTRVSAWALDCFNAGLSSSKPKTPPIFPSPSRRKLYLRKRPPTSWVTQDVDAPLSLPSSVRMAVSAAESLMSSRTPASTVPLSSPLTRYLPRSWAPATAPLPRPSLKTNASSFSADSTSTSDRPATPSELWMSTTATFTDAAAETTSRYKAALPSPVVAVAPPSRGDARSRPRRGA